MYMKLAEEFLHHSYKFRRHSHQKKVDETMQGETFVILYIQMEGGSVIPSEISKVMNISSARIAAVLNSLEGKELVTRKIDSEDRRRVLVDLTEKGKAKAEEHYHMVLALTTRMLTMLGERDAHDFVRITGRLADLALEGEVEK